jgi:hypothetical protein
MLSIHIYVWVLKFDGLKSLSSYGVREEGLVSFGLPTYSLF